MRRVLIAGCGDVGGRLAAALLERGKEVLGIRRNLAALPAGVLAARVDLMSGVGLDRLASDIDTLVFCAAAGRSSEAAYRGLYVDGLARVMDALPSLARVVFTSSTAVYAQRDGEWVDEDSATEPVRYNGAVMLEAEALALSHAGGQVLRLGGIYGPGRDRLLRRAREGAPCRESPPRYTNRIRSDDAARALEHLLRASPGARRVWLGVDSDPAAEHVVRDWLAGRMGLPAPPRERGSSGDSQNKRCSNQRLIASGFEFHFPGFRQGYGALLAGR